MKGCPVPKTDMDLEALRTYAPQIVEPSDFDDFWSSTLEANPHLPDRVIRTRAETPITELVAEDLEFAGYNGDPIHAWIVRPQGSRALPAVVEYQGYGGGRGLVGEKSLWALTGRVHVFMDTRGQGSGWGTGGDTPDPHGSGPATEGSMTRGILDEHDYYYRRVYVDAVRLLDAVAGLDCVDERRIAVTGGSQGGGIAIAAAALSRWPVLAMPDVPFLCHFRRSVDVAALPPYTELVRYLAVHRAEEDRVFRTLSYFDGASLARRITIPTRMSVALMDDIVPPSSVFAAYNALPESSRVGIDVYPFNGHEGGGVLQWQKLAAWCAAESPIAVERD
jgi:cephalosporin-C deacetylase